MKRIKFVGLDVHAETIAVGSSRARRGIAADLQKAVNKHYGDVTPNDKVRAQVMAGTTADYAPVWNCPTFAAAMAGREVFPPR